MLSLRWKKVVRDLWINRSRSLLAVLAMTVGMIGISAVLCAYSILVRELDANYMRTNPASATIVTEAVNDDLVKALQRFPGIGSVEIRGFFEARILVSEDEWKTLFLFVVDDFSAMRINKSKPEEGRWPPQTSDILIERAAMQVVKKRIGEDVVVRLPGVSQRKLHIAGTIHDPAQAPAWMEGLAYGYVTRDTLNLFGKTALNEILLTVSDRPFDRNVPRKPRPSGRGQVDQTRPRGAQYNESTLPESSALQGGELYKTHIRTTVKSVTNWMEKLGYRIQRIDIPEPGHHPHQTQLKALLFLLQAFGVLSFVLSTILVVTLIGAIMAQQVRQIGVMKAIGARTFQMAGMYLGGALLLGIVAVVVGLPAGLAVARGYAGFAAKMLNFEIVDATVPLWTYAVLVLIGLLTPVLSSSYPVYKGSRISVRQAITDYGIPADQTANGLLNRVFALFPRLPRPLLLSLRNTFRRRGRILLTLGTLAIGGAMFITALNVGVSIKKTIRGFQAAMRYDLKVSFTQPVTLNSVEAIVGNVPGVTRFEGWSQARASLIYEDGTDGNEFTIVAPTSKTDLLRPRVIKGRMLSSEDRDALLVNHIFMYREPHLNVGDDVILRIGTQKTKFRIVGVIRQIGPPTAFANGSYLAGLMNQKGLVKTLPIVTKERSTDAHLAVTRQLERAFTEAGIDVQETVSTYDIQKILEDHFLVLTMLLLFMSVLIVIVGGLGLTTTMSIQVIERTREIGVMRAIGASSHNLLKIISIEGLVVGIVSWILAVILALPISRYVSDLFGMIFLRTTLDFAFSPIASLLWLGVVIVFSLVASFFPARNATRLTVRETLVYE